MESNGDRRTLLAEMFNTDKERTAAWSYRILVLIISGLGGLSLWLANAQLTDLKSSIAASNKMLWDSITTLSASQQRNTNSITETNGLIAAHIAEDSQFDNGIKSSVQDHEARIRTLEHTLHDPP